MNPLALIRALPPKAWLWLGLTAAALLLALWLFNAGRGVERADRERRDAAAGIRAGVGRETAATERTLDNAAVAAKLEQWNHDAEQTPDAAPDDRELRRRCRQLRDAGRTGLAACRGFEGAAQAGPL